MKNIFDYFNNSFSNLENVLLQNGFLLNYKKFTHYFSKDLTNYDDDEEEDEEQDNDEEELTLMIKSKMIVYATTIQHLAPQLCL